MLNQLQESFTYIANQTQNNLSTLLNVVAILWASFFLNKLLGNRLFILGIFPRKLYGIPGIFFSPFLHADFNHLFFNTIPFVVLANFIMIYGVPFFYNISIFIIIGSGILTWLIGKPGIHIGASGLITGYWVYLLGDSYYHLSATSIIIFLIVVYYFAGIFFGLFPTKERVSWEGHLSGAIAGICVALIQNLA